MEALRSDEMKQLQTAWRNFLRHTRSTDSETDDLQTFFQSKVQLFRMFLRTQSIDVRQFGIFHREHERIFFERLFYLVLNNVELTNFSTFNFYSIVSLSRELEKYQEATKKLIGNATKLNGIIQFVLSFSPSTVSTFRLNNLFYLLLNDMNDFSGKMIDRFAELLRLYHWMTFGHSIRKQTMISMIDYNIHTANFANPIVYPLYENFLNASYVYKGPLLVSVCARKHRISLFTMIQNLAILLLGLTVDDFDSEETFLQLTSEQCYHIRLTVRHLNSLFHQHQLTIDYPVENVDKEILLHLIKLIVREEKSFDSLRRLLDQFFHLLQRCPPTRLKRLLYELLSHRSLEFYAIETLRYFLEQNRSSDVTDEQLRLVTHRLFSREIFAEVFVPVLNGDVEEILRYLDENARADHSSIDLEQLKTSLTVRS